MLALVLFFVLALLIMVFPFTSFSKKLYKGHEGLEPFLEVYCFGGGLGILGLILLILLLPH